MTKPLDNPILKQIIANIAKKTSVGRTPQLNWTVLTEAKKKKQVKEVSNMAPVKKKADNTEERPADEIPSDDVGPAGTPPAKGEPDAGAEQGSVAPGAPPLETAPKDGESATDQNSQPEPGTEAGDEPPAETPEDAEADASKAKAELEKAKAEKDQAEKDIKKHSYVNLVSQAGVHFLLGKLIDHAFKTNTIDSLASEMVGKLKIQTPEDFTNFAEEMAPYRGIPGVAELLAAMKGMATKQPETEEQPDSV